MPAPQPVHGHKNSHPKNSVISRYRIRSRWALVAWLLAAPVLAIAARPHSTAGAAPKGSPSPDPVVSMTVLPADPQAPVSTVNYSPAGGAALALAKSADAGGGVLVTATNGGPLWDLQAIAAGGSQLAIGSYPAARAAFSTTHPWLRARYTPACQFSEPAAQRMTVIDVAFDPDGTPTRLALDFQIDCLPGDPIATIAGHVRIGSAAPIDPAIRRPAPFPYAPVTGVAPGGVAVSTPATIRGINVPVGISVSGGEYSVDGGAFTVLPGSIAAGQQLQVRVATPAYAGGTAIAHVVVGERTESFHAATTQTPFQQMLTAPYVALRTQALASGTLSEEHFHPITGKTVESPEAPFFGNVRSVITVTPAGGSMPEITLNLAGPGGNGTRLLPGTYPARPFGSITKANVSAGPSARSSFCRFSPEPAIELVVHEAAYDANGRNTCLAADYTAFCGLDSTEPLSLSIGQIRFNSAIPVDHSVRRPVPFVFPSQAGVAPGQVVESAAVTIRGINRPVPVRVTGGEASIDNGPFSIEPGSISAGQALRVRLTAAATFNTLTTATAQVGEGSATFSVGTRPGSPPQVSGPPVVVVVSQGDEPLGQGRTRVFSPATLSTLQLAAGAFGRGIVLHATDAATGGLWRFEFEGPGGQPLAPLAYSGAARFPFNGAQPGLSASAPSLVCDPISGDFTVHEIEFEGATPTKLAVDFTQYCPPYIHPMRGYIRIGSTVSVAVPTDTIPRQIAFGNYSGVDQGYVAVSPPVTLEEFDVPVPIIVAGGEYSLDGAPFTTSPGMASPGQSLRVRATAAEGPSETVMVSVDIGSMVAIMRVTTSSVDNLPAAFSFVPVPRAARGQSVASEVIIPTSYTVNLVARVTGGEISIAGRPFTSTSTIIQPGETLQVRVTASELPGVTTSATVEVGSRSATFTVTSLNRVDLTVDHVGRGNVTAAPLLACAASCTITLDEGTSLTLSAQPLAGYLFAGWSGGGCSGTGACAVTLAAATTVLATFVPPPPGAPQVIRAIPGDGRAAIVFEPAGGPTSAGATYTATCQPGSISASAAQSPVTVTGLANDQPYLCSVVASSIHGTGSASAAVAVTPAGNAPLQIAAAQSRMTHGDGGALDIPLNLAATPATATVESRHTGGTLKLVLQLNAPATSAGTVAVTDHMGAAAGTGSAGTSGNEVILELSGIADAKRLTVAVAGINGSLAATVHLGVLAGDVNDSGVVDAGDAAAVRSQSGGRVRADTARHDVNASGGISAGDVAAVKARIGRSLP